MFKPFASVVWGLVLTLGLPITHAYAQNLQKFKVGEVVRSQLFAPMYVAINQSFFRDQGIELDLITANGGDRVGALVLACRRCCGECHGTPRRPLLFQESVVCRRSYLLARLLTVRPPTQPSIW